MNASLQRADPNRAGAGLLASSLLALALLSGCITNTEKLVTVHSVVAPGYMSARSATDPMRTDTFAISKGRLLTQSAYDSRVEKVDFPAMARMLAADLKTAHFEPASSANTADLVIVVHWGLAAVEDKLSDQTLYDPDSLRQAQEALVEAKAREAADTSGLSRALGVAAAAEANLRAETNAAASLYSGDDLKSTSTAALLGFSEVLRLDDNSPAASETADTLRSMLEEDRYFVILVAYDAKALRTGQRRRLWTTQISITAKGLTFADAIARMSGAAAPHYGVREAAITILNGVARPGTAEVVDVPLMAEPRR